MPRGGEKQISCPRWHNGHNDSMILINGVHDYSAKVIATCICLSLSAYVTLALQVGFIMSIGCWLPVINMKTKPNVTLAIQVWHQSFYEINMITKPKLLSWHCHFTFFRFSYFNFQFFPKLYIIICKPHQNDRRWNHHPASFSCHNLIVI